MLTHLCHAKNITDSGAYSPWLDVIFPHTPNIISCPDLLSHKYST